MKLIKQILPLHDLLYIYQNLEYEPVDFLKWSAKNFWRRDLQQKHRLNYTSKAKFILAGSYLLLLICSLSVAGWLVGVWWLFPVIWVFLELFSAIFILAAQALLTPFEAYRRRKIIAAAKLKQSQLKDLKVVAIVGSFAKTSIKDMLYTILWKDFYVVKTPKSYNTELSIAETMLYTLKPTTQVFLCEMDAYHPGDIRQLAQIARPDLGMITSIAPQHLERFGSMDKLATTQFEIDQALPASGKLFLNATDEWSNQLAATARNELVWFGGEGDVTVSHLKQTVTGLEFKLHTKKESVEVKLPLFGEHHAQNFAAAAAIALELGMSLKKIAARAAQILPTPHRLEVRQQGNITIIDNTYNSNPSASKAALALLKDYPGDQKILITPGLVELGDKFEEENQRFAENAAQVADQIIIVGQNAKQALIKGLNEANYPQNQRHLVDSTVAGLQKLASISSGNSVVLLENDLPDQYS